MIRREKKGDQLRVTFALPDTEHAGRVSVVGDFNDWTPGVHPLRRRSNGTRSAVIRLPAGTPVEFRYLGEDGQWFDDPDADGRHRDNGVLFA